MLEFIKTNRTALLAVLAVLSISLNIYFVTDSGIKKDIIHGLEQTNGVLYSQQREAQKKEKAYLKEIKKKKKTIAALDKKLAESVKKYKQLKTEMDAVTKPEPPRDFKDLNECNEKYASLYKGYKLTYDLGKETGIALTLCLEKSKEQQDVILLAENAYKECQKQGKLKDVEIKSTREALNQLDRVYKRKRLKRGIAHGTLGAIIGGIATYFILKRK